MSKGIVYLVQPEEFIGTNIFKIGRSKDSSANLNRIKSYGKGSSCISINQRNNTIELEKKIIEEFNKNFKLVKGREYFEGDKEEINKLFLYIVSTYTYKENDTDTKNESKSEIEGKIESEVSENKNIENYKCDISYEGEKKVIEKDTDKYLNNKQLLEKKTFKNIYNDVILEEDRYKQINLYEINFKAYIKTKNCIINGKFCGELLSHNCILLDERKYITIYELEGKLYDRAYLQEHLPYMIYYTDKYYYMLDNIKREGTYGDHNFIGKRRCSCCLPTCEICNFIDNDSKNSIYLFRGWYTRGEKEFNEIKQKFINITKGKICLNLDIPKTNLLLGI